MNPGNAGKTYALTGPRALTFTEMATAMSAATGRAVRYFNITDAQAKAAMLQAGLPEWIADFINGLRRLAVTAFADSGDQAVKGVS